MIKILSILLLLATLGHGQLLLRNATLANYRMVYAPTNTGGPNTWTNSLLLHATFDGGVTNGDYITMLPVGDGITTNNGIVNSGIYLAGTSSPCYMTNNGGWNTFVTSISNEATMAFWVYSTANLTDYGPLFCFTDDQDAYLGWYRDGTGLRTFINNQNKAYYNMYGYLNLNTWTHLVLIKTPTNVIAYSNGIEYMRADHTDNVLWSFSGSYPFALKVGNHISVNYTQKGYYDEMCVWARSLSSNEVVQLYNGGYGFNPVTLQPSRLAPWQTSNLVLFAEAQSVAGAAGVSVTSLPDQSPNNVAVTDENNGHQFILTNNIAELNGKKWMIDNGTNRLRVFAPTVTQPYSVFVLMRDNEADTRNAFVLEGLSQIVQNVIGATWVYCGQSSYVTQVPQATWTLVEIKFNGASSEFWTNGVNSGTFNPGTADLANFKLGARWNTDEAGIYGGYAALGIYGNISDDSRALIRNYYRTNYALPIPATNLWINQPWDYSYYDFTGGAILSQSIAGSTPRAISKIDLYMSMGSFETHVIKVDVRTAHNGGGVSLGSVTNTITTGEAASTAWHSFVMPNIITTNKTYINVSCNDAAPRWRIGVSATNEAPFDGTAYGGTEYSLYAGVDVLINFDGAFRIYTIFP